MDNERDSYLEDAIWKSLKSVIDPELGINIVDMGMVYRVEAGDGKASVDITMTSPTCPLHVTITEEARQAILKYNPAVKEAEVQVVWEPPWSPEKMSEAAKEKLLNQ